MTLGEIVIFEKEKTSIPWKEISKSLRVEEKVFSCLKSTIHYVNQKNPSVLLISQAESKNLPWKFINPLIQSHLNASSQKFIVSSNVISDPIFPVIETTPAKIIDTLENIIHEKFIMESLKQYRGLPVGNGKIMLGESPAMIKLFKIILKRSNGDENCLIYGETGSGKTVTTDALHYHHPRRSKYGLEIVNTGEISDTVFEAEFFGAKKGAYTGCTQDRSGLFDKTQGTLFIDEIGNLPMNSQNKLLRALGDKKYKPVGSQDSKEIKARLIFATNKDLKQMVVEKTFMEDLLFRIEKLSIHIPSLRERKEDIPLLIQDYVNTLNRRYGKSKQVQEEVCRYLMLYSWPGNIRELQGKLDVAFEESNGSNVTADHFRDIEIDSKLLLQREQSKTETHVHFISLYSSGNSQDKKQASISSRAKEKMIERNTRRKELSKNTGISESALCRLLNPKSEKMLIGLSPESISRLEYWIETGSYLPLNGKEIETTSSENKIRGMMERHQLSQQDFGNALDVSKQAVSKWLRKLNVDEQENFIYKGIPKDKAEMIIYMLKNGKLSLNPSNEQTPLCG